MIESIDIMWLMPDWINIKLWENMYTVYMDKWKYVLNEQLNEYLEVDNVEIYVNDKLFDTIDRRIALRTGDTLHLEYSIHAEQ